MRSGNMLIFFRRYDYIMLLDALHNQVGRRHCGKLMRPLTIDVLGNAAIIVFRSDESNNKKGFQITYRAYVSNLSSWNKNMKKISKTKL